MDEKEKQQLDKAATAWMLEKGYSISGYSFVKDESKIDKANAYELYADEQIALASCRVDIIKKFGEI